MSTIRRLRSTSLRSFSTVTPSRNLSTLLTKGVKCSKGLTESYIAIVRSRVSTTTIVNNFSVIAQQRIKMPYNVDTLYPRWVFYGGLLPFWFKLLFSYSVIWEWESWLMKLDRELGSLCHWNFFILSIVLFYIYLMKTLWYCETKINLLLAIESVY